MVDDMILQARVMDELVWEPNVDTAHIGVTARNGVPRPSGLTRTTDTGVCLPREPEIVA